MSDTTVLKKPAVINLLLVAIVSAYNALGGLIFMQMDTSAVVRPSEPAQCACHNGRVVAWVQPLLPNRCIPVCRPLQPDYKLRWTYSEAVSFAFSVNTAMSFGLANVSSTSSKVFYLLYALFGIPLTMLVLANLGRFLRAAVTSTFNKFVWRRLRPLSQPVEDTNPFIVLTIFAAYLLVGATATSVYGLSDRSYMNGMFLNFRAITADFSDVVPNSPLLIPFVLAYLSIGLMIITMAVDMAGVYLRKLNNVGRELEKVDSMKIWFGGESMKVIDLAVAFGTKFNVPKKQIDNLNLDNLVKQRLNNEIIVPDGENTEENILLTPMEEHLANIWEENGQIDDSVSANLAPRSLPPPDPIMHDER